MSNNTKIVPNQIRARTNQHGVTNYYIVMKDNDGMFAAWFRSTDDEPLHISRGFLMKTSDPLIMNNINNFKPSLEKIHEKATQ